MQAFLQTQYDDLAVTATMGRDRVSLLLSKLKFSWEADGEPRLMETLVVLGEYYRSSEW